MGLLRLCSPQQIYLYEARLIEADLDGLTSDDIQHIVSQGSDAETQLSDIKEGKIVLLSDSPKQPLFRVNDKQQLTVSPSLLTQHSHLLAALKHRLPWEAESTDTYGFGFASGGTSGVGGAAGSFAKGEDLAEEPAYQAEAVKPDEALIDWEILINEELYRFAPNRHDLNKGLPVQVVDDSGCKLDFAIDGLKITFKLAASISSCVLTFFPEGNPAGEPCDETWPNTNFKKMFGNSIKFTKQDWLPEKSGKVSFRIPAAKGAILHPSLTCPVLGNPNQQQPVRILLALESDFITKQFEQDKDTQGNEGGPWVRRAIHAQLCCNPIDQQKSATLPNDCALFESHNAAINNMRVYHLGSLTGERQLIRNNLGEAWTVLRQSSAQWYKEQSFTELVQVDIDPAALVSFAKGGSQLYDLAWISIDQDGEAYFISRDKQKYPSNPHVEQQDIDQGLWHQSGDAYKQGVYSLASIKDCDRSNIKALSVDTCGADGEEAPTVKQCHPLYISTKPLLNPGQLTDVHISSRQHIFTASKAQVIPGASQDDSPYLGDLCNISFLALKNLMDQMGQNKDIDLLVFTGDLVDYCINLDPEQCQDVNSTGGIWQHMTLAKENDPNIYPKYIDDLMAFGLFDYFIKTYGKPIILISGNHEAYEMPYGISPRFYGSEMVNDNLAVGSIKAQAYALITSVSSAISLSEVYKGANEVLWIETNAMAENIVQRLKNMLDDEQPKNIRDITQWFENSINAIDAELEKENQLDEEKYQQYLETIDDIESKLKNREYEHLDMLEYIGKTLLQPLAYAEKEVEIYYNEAASSVNNVITKSAYIVNNGWQRLKNLFSDDQPENIEQISQQRVHDLKALGQKFKANITSIKDGRNEAFRYFDGLVKKALKSTLNLKANEGIPADHNLTIYEACLLYGEEYGHLNTTFNFASKNFEWFYQVFCPMSDFILTHDQQQWVGLEWGDAEDFMKTKVEGGGVLPRATESCNAEQLQLVQEASDDASKPNRVLLSHFTLVNFPTDAAIYDTWEINTNDVGIKAKFIGPSAFPLAVPLPVVYEVGDRDNGEEGSFHLRRKELYQDHVLTGKFKYCLAGHSHRAGLYQASNIRSDTFEATGLLPHEYQPHSLGNDKPRILVSGSGGPVSKQNLNGELAGQGMDISQGTWVDIANDQFHLVTADPKSVPQAQPRFAVALDYMELVGGETIFKGFKTLDIAKGEFVIELNSTLPKEPFIDTIKLHYVDKVTLAPIGKLNWDIQWVVQGNRTILTLSSKEWKKFVKRTESLSNSYFEKLNFYISVHFNKALNQQVAYQAYRFDTPWCYPVALVHYPATLISVSPSKAFSNELICPERWQIERDREEPQTTDYGDLSKNIKEYA